MNAVLLWLVPFLPLLLALLVVWPRLAWLRHLTPWAVLPGLAAALFLSDGAHGTYPWLLLGLELQLDAVGRVFLMLTALLWGAAGLYALEYLRGDAHEGRFHLFFLLAMAGNLGLVLAADAVGFYLFFALMSLAAYGLVIHTGGEAARRAGRIYLILAVLGEMLLFAGLALQVFAAGGTHFALLSATPPDPYTLGLLMLGFGIKAGLLPLHVWLPLAHPAAPVPASAVLSGSMIKAGLLGGLRLVQPEGPDWPEPGGLLLALGLAGAFFAAVAGVMQRRPKTILAYSSIGQMGFMVSGVGLALMLPDARAPLLAAVVLYAVHHGFAKGALFLGVGIVERRRSVWVMAVLTVPALALAGLPWTSGALAKQALKAPLAGLPPGWTGMVEFLLSLAAVGTTLLMARFLWCLGTANSTGRGGLSWRMTVPWLGVSSVSLLLPWWWLGAVGPAWSLLWPLGLGLLMAALAVVAGARLGYRLPLVPEGDLLVAVERAVVGLFRRIRAVPFLDRPHGEDLVRARFRLAWRRLRHRMGRLEAGLTRWESVGVLFMALVMGIFASLHW